MGSFIVGGILVILFILAIVKIVNDKKKGGCSGCSQSGTCQGCKHTEKVQK